jgi:hypothetical protein
MATISDLQQIHDRRIAALRKIGAAGNVGYVEAGDEPEWWGQVIWFLAAHDLVFKVPEGKKTSLHLTKVGRAAVKKARG